jgi:ribonuclease-3
MKREIHLEFQNKIKIKFNDSSILKQSLIHKSFSAITNNEKLEFLGDRVLGLVLSKTLLQNYPKEKEGIIDKKFANLVNKKICAKIANSLNIKKYMILGDSFKGHKRSDEKITSDALEALIGAIFLDKGLDAAERFILLHWKDLLIKSDFTVIDAKTKLQEYSLKKYKQLPQYQVEKQTGPKHSPIFKVEVKIPDSKKYLASGSSKKNAQQNAAQKLLNDLKI